MVTAAAESLRRHGLAGTSFTEVLAQSGAARGAIYHHFPGGKAELVTQAVEQTGENVSAALAALPQATDETEVIDSFLTLIRPVVEESTRGAGCAVAAITTAAAPGDPLQLTARCVFDQWRVELAHQLELAGASATRANETAALLIATLEGTHVLCRADGTITPFDRAAAALRAAFGARAAAPSRPAQPHRTSSAEPTR